jgi:hypothetical protein
MSESPVPDPSTLAGQQQLVDDVVLLLDYLSRVPGSRLDWCFAETRGPATAIPAGLAVPPVAGKDAFVDQVMQAAFKVRRAADAREAAPLDAHAISFLIRARDFLSVVAQPASVESIRVTHAYCEERARRRGQRLLGLLGRAPDPPAEGRAGYYGRRIARRRNHYQALLIGLALVTIWLSFQTLVGQRLIAERQRLGLLWDAHAERAAKAMADDQGLLNAFFHGEEAARPLHGLLRYCDYPAVLNDPPRLQVAGPGAPGEAPPPRFLNSRHQAVCDERADLEFRVAMLRGFFDYWGQGLAPVVGLVRLPGEFWRGGYDIACRTGLAATDWLRGRLPAGVRPAAAEGDRCQPFARRADRTGAGPGVAPTTQLHFVSVGTEAFTDGLLEHVLPCLYAVLGALAAMFRRLTRRLSDETISVGDFGEMRMTLILGVLAGAVIGLFSGYLGEAADPATRTLTVAGLALLAGYAVDRLFGMFDAASARVFGGGDGTRPAA